MERSKCCITNSLCFNGLSFINSSSSVASLEGSQVPKGRPQYGCGYPEGLVSLHLPATETVNAS